MAGPFKVTNGWKRFDWVGSLPVRMRTLSTVCNECGVDVDIVEIKRYEGKLLDFGKKIKTITKPNKKKNEPNSNKLSNRSSNNNGRKARGS